jgi:uronate dehydrogenase
MRTVLVTGAAGGIGTRLRKLLKGVYPQIRWSDIRPPLDQICRMLKSTVIRRQ